MPKLVEVDFFPVDVQAKKKGVPPPLLAARKGLRRGSGALPGGPLAGVALTRPALPAFLLFACTRFTNFKHLY